MPGPDRPLSPGVGLPDVRPEETRLVALLFVHSFLIGIPRLLTATAAMALFLTYFEARHLPYVYIAAAVAIPLTSFLRLKLAARLSFVRLLTVDLGFVLVVLLALRILLAGRWPGGVAMVLPVWYEIEWVLLSLEFWGLAGQVVNVRQGKRLFGVIGTGELLAATLVGLAAPAIVQRLGTANLLLVSAASVALCLALLAAIARAFPMLEASPGPERAVPDRRRYADLLRSRYLLLVFALVALSYLGYYVLDNAFYNVAQARARDAGELASFLGVFWAVAALITLGFRTILSSRVLSRYGLVGGLLALPAAVGAGVTVISASALLGAGAGLLFWLMSLTKLCDQSLRDSLDRSAVLVLYQPLPPPQRVRAQTAVEGIVGPLAGGVSGIVLLVLIQVLRFQAVQLSWLLVLIVAAWVAVAVWLRREYSETLSRALASRRLGMGSLGLADASSRAVLLQGLRSPRAAEVLYCLEALAGMGHRSYAESLPSLLDHRAAEVRREALLSIERLRLEEAADEVRRRAQTEPEPELRGLALRVLAVVGGTEDLARLTLSLDDGVESVRMGATAGLLRLGGGAEEARRRIAADATAADPARRLFAARAIGEAAVPALASALTDLLRDGEPRVRAAAIAAAGRVGEPGLWPLVVEALGDPSVRSAAASTLLAAGPAAADALIAALDACDAPARASVDWPRRRRLLRLLGRAGGDRAAATLWRAASGAAAEVRDVALPSLAVRPRPAGLAPASVRERVRAEAIEGASILAVIEDLGAEPVVEILRLALVHEMVRARERILWLLSLLYSPEAVLRARAHLWSRSAEKRAQAVELIDSLADPEIAALVIPFVEDVPDDVRRARLAALLPEGRRARGDQIARLVVSGGGLGPWTRACALWVAGEVRRGDLEEAVRRAGEDGEELVREAAAHALRRFRGEPKGIVGGGEVLSTIEKVVVLKGVSLFSETPDEVLADVAALLEEVDVDAGEVVFEKGDVGSALYVVVEGKVRVTSQDRVLVELGPRDIFGEMAALDTEPRSATVTALEPTSLFRLEQEALYELMADRIEVVRGVIRILCSRLRRVTDRETTGWGRVIEPGGRA
ncbi:MAG TPA: cyclic nucleotide-binding domain-containing protein [Vicinamibacteria bacterium]|nr:cyclic nucleotide-binding domain-containing protein [Vicinamibacteria bacterium]